MRIKDFDVLFRIKLISLSLAYFTRRKYLSVITRKRKGLKTVNGACTVDAEGLGLDSVNSREHGRGGRPGDSENPKHSGRMTLAGMCQAAGHTRTRSGALPHGI